MSRLPAAGWRAGKTHLSHPQHDGSHRKLAVRHIGAHDSTEDATIRQLNDICGGMSDIVVSIADRRRHACLGMRPIGSFDATTIRQ